MAIRKKNWGKDTAEMYTQEVDEEEPKERGPDKRCTPELLLEFMLHIGRYPTMGELKYVFGGILGPLIDGWELQRRGEWPEL